MRWKINEMWYGAEYADRVIYDHDIDIGYEDLATCPGSSGARVVTWVVQGVDRPMMHWAPHSCGYEDGEGQSGRGESYALT